ncbi:uncharacterized protein LOC131976721 [Centropristis striata]|uniref:uncharacterized protein LOC131976721 n=1 Tax=Centropristis striata TaxID=184440 RepID=UPI0027E0F589|nr:uncharacterized protein LOC131976721 [Centropristis striata]
MSITVVKDKMVVGRSPPPHHILKTLCFTARCSVNTGLMQANVTAALGTIQIMVGLFNIGLGPARISTNPEDFTSLGATYWLGAVFIVAGVLSLVIGRFSSLFLLGLAVLLNIVGSFFSIVAVVLYAFDLADAPAAAMCHWNGYGVRNIDNCKYAANFAQRLLTTVDITMIVLAVLQLCVCISIAALGIKAVFSRKEEEVSVCLSVYLSIYIYTHAVSQWRPTSSRGGHPTTGSSPTHNIIV